MRTKHLPLLLLVALLGTLEAAPAPDDREGTRAFQAGEYTRAFEIWSHLAGQQNHRAQFLLSTLYYDGKGVPKDTDKGLQWLKSAAAGGFPPAQFNLGNNYFNGNGVPEDPEQAVAWWTRAAQQGFVQAQYNLGVAYITGRGTPQNPQEAVHWFDKAARAGSEGAQKALERMGIASGSKDVVAHSPATAKNRGVRDFAWLMARPPGHYTIQLSSSHDRIKAIDFAQQVAALGEVTLFSSTREGMQWFTVTLGSFPTQAAAEQTKAKLPLSRWNTSGWVRSFKGIHRIARQP